MRQAWKGGLVVALVGVLAIAFAGIAAGKTKTKTFSTGNIASAIDDQDVLVQDVRVRKQGKLKDVNVNVRATHTAATDLSLILLSPKGKLVTMVTNPDNADDDLGSGATSCSGSFLTLDDEASDPVENADVLDGALRPDEPLSRLDGQKIKGKWRLIVVDGDGGDEGTLHCAQLELKYKAKKKK
jgi:subtilisin-like proprotein convertase family protein